MRPRDATVAGWAAAFLVIFLATYCALMGERLSYSVQDWWQEWQQAEEEE